MSPKVSVVVRTKDRPLLLERALRSVLGQDMTDFELVVVNDRGDLDQVKRLLGQLDADADPRVKLVDNGGDPGRAGALDTGVTHATGTYFAIHDDDDSWHPSFLAKTCEHLDAHPDDAAVATHTDVVHEVIDGATITELARDPLARDTDVASFVETLWANYIPPIAMVLRRSVFDSIGRFDPDLPVLEDWEFNLRLMSRHTVGFVGGESLAYWHQRESSIGADGNSVVVDARDHEMFNLLIRDDYLRKSLVDGSGLGPLAAAAMMIRRVDLHVERVDRRVEHVGQRIEETTVAQREQLSELSQVMSLEIGRLRGEVLALRELLVESTKGSGSTA